MMLRPLYIFDLDGTLADLSHRVHLLGDWDAYYSACCDDDPIEPVINTMLLIIDSGAEVWIWTARSSGVRTSTLKWIEDKVGVKWKDKDIRMREKGERQNDDVLKRCWLEEMRSDDRSRLVTTFEDRQRVVKMWRRSGVTCFQVDEGKF